VLQDVDTPDDLDALGGLAAPRQATGP